MSGHPATSSNSTPSVQLVPPGFYNALPAIPETTEEDNKGEESIWLIIYIWKLICPYLYVLLIRCLS
jgi:hypothetical protein